MAVPYIGEIRIFSSSTVPYGWLPCNGQLLPITQNQGLYSVIGDTYGGDGRTTFALPDLRARAAMMAGEGPHLTARTLGEEGGVENVTLDVSQMPQHTHVLGGNNNAANSRDPQNDLLARASGGYPYLANSSQLTSMASESVATVFSGGAHINMQPFLTLQLCICNIGILPSFDDEEDGGDY